MRESVEIELDIIPPKTISKEEYKRSIIEKYTPKRKCKNPEILRMMKNGN